MATKNDVISLAFQRLGMGIAGDDVTGENALLANAILTSDMAYLAREAPTYWDNNGVIPDEAVMLMADLLAVGMAPTFSLSPPISRATAVIRIFALVRPDDRLNPSDPAYY